MNSKLYIIIEYADARKIEKNHGKNILSNYLHNQVIKN
jgi:hypothetical protein